VRVQASDGIARLLASNSVDTIRGVVAHAFGDQLVCDFVRGDDTVWILRRPPRELQAFWRDWNGIQVRNWTRGYKIENAFFVIKNAMNIVEIF
jgi:hypothetical protein